MATRKNNRGVAPVATPLTLNINPDTLTLDDIEVFEPGGFTVRGFKSFMAKYSTWSDAQIGALTVAQLRELSGEIGRAVAGAVVPKVNGAA